MRSIVLLDLDSTLCHTLHRSHLAPKGEASFERDNWVEFAMACWGDDPIEGTAELVRLLANQYDIFIVSGRAEEARNLTIAWLAEHEIPWDSIKLNSGGAKSIGQYKQEYALSLRRMGYHIVLGIDDYPSVVDAYAQIGIPCVCVNPQYPDPAPHHADNATDAVA